ncbi:tumor necrosis factor ligand superfamily member 14 [Clarias gariepinus]
MGEVFVVDSQATADIVPPKHWIKGTCVVYVLLGLALFGVMVEGVLIYQLYQRIPKQTSPEMSQMSKLTGGNKTQDDGYSTETSAPQQVLKTESKPAAFLHHQNHSVSSDMTVLQWDARGFPAFQHSFNYSNGSLIIHKEGFYYLFSKVTYRSSCQMFRHEVKLNSSRYNHHPISLMIDSRYGVERSHANKKSQFSSYLGGVMHLFKTDMVFVSISNHSCLIEETQETFFGGFMI